MNEEQERTQLAELIFKNINYFAIKNKKYKPIWDSLDKNVREVIKIGLNEVVSLKPNMWDAWWLINHGRFTISGRNCRAMHTLMYQYLTDYAHKRIGTNIKIKEALPI